MTASSFGAVGATFFIRTFDKNAPISQADLDDLVRYIELTSTIVAIGPFIPGASESVWMIIERVDVSSVPGYVVSETAGVTMDPNGIISLGSLLDLGITDGTNGQVLTTDGNGNFSFTTISGVSGFSGDYDDLTNKPTLIKTAPQWTVNHTLADGTRYLAGDVVYDNGNVYVANFDNESEPTSNATYWTNLGAGNRINVDGRDIPNIQYSQIANTPALATVATSGSYNDLTDKPTIPASILDLSITDGTSGQVLTTDGAGNFTFQNAGALNTGDITFDGVKIIGAGTASGDGLGYATMELVPDNNLYGGDQYLVIDPTGPNHIHIRAGGIQDQSSAQLFVGGENIHLTMHDGDQFVRMNGSSLQTIHSAFISAGVDYSTAEWTTDGVNNLITFNDVQQTTLNAIWGLNGTQNNIEIYDGSSYYTVSTTGSGTPGVGLPATVTVDLAPPTSPITVVSAFFTSQAVRSTYVEVDGTDVRIEAQDDIRMYSRDIFLLANYSSTDPIRISTNYDAGSKDWSFTSDGVLELPNGGDITRNGVSVIPNLATVATTGSYNDLADKPTIPTALTDLGITDGTNGQVLTTDGAGGFTFTTVTGGGGGIALTDLSVTTSGTPVPGGSLSYDNTTGTFTFAPADYPTFATVATSGDYLDLMNTPMLSTVATSGSYNDLTNTPDLSVYQLSSAAFSGDYADLANKPTLFSGDYNDLVNEPILFSGSYNDLTNKPNFATVATSGSYADLTNKPTIPTAVSQLTNDSGYLTAIPDDTFVSKTAATGVVAHDCNTSRVFIHDSVTANFTANLTNLNLAAGSATVVTLVINQGATAHIANALEIGGVAQTINWQGSTTAPSGNANKKDVISFNIFNVAGAYTVLGQLVSFG